MRRTLVLALPLLFTSCGVWPTACEFADGGSYTCWHNEYQDFCESDGGTWSANTHCKDLGYTHRCTEEEVGGGLEDQWTVGAGCDDSVAPPEREPDPGSVLTACRDARGICSALKSGSASSFEEECRSEGNTVVESCATGAYQCTDGSGTSAGATVTIDLHWPDGICSDPAFADQLYLRGTCDSIGGTYAGDGDACCTTTTAPGPGGLYCL